MRSQPARAHESGAKPGMNTGALELAFSAWDCICATMCARKWSCFLTKETLNA
jgi:hypothetical protein